MQRIRNVEHGKRKGGVIWHTQGSGKSLTMVMLAQAIAWNQAFAIQKLYWLPTEPIWTIRLQAHSASAAGL
jgi:hypothetical protein